MCVITAATEVEFNQSGLRAVTQEQEKPFVWKRRWKMSRALLCNGVPHANASF